MPLRRRTLFAAAALPHWDDDELHALHNLSGSDFEVVDVGSLH